MRAPPGVRSALLSYGAAEALETCWNAVKSRGKADLSAETQKDEHPWVFAALGITIVIILTGVLAALLLRSRNTSFAPPPSVGPAPVSRWGFRSDVGVRVNNLKRVRVPQDDANAKPASGREVLLINVTVTNLSNSALVVRPEEVRFISGEEKEYAAQRPSKGAAAGQERVLYGRRIAVLGGTLGPSESATGDVVTSREAAPISDAGYR